MNMSQAQEKAMLQFLLAVLAPMESQCREAVHLVKSLGKEYMVEILRTMPGSPPDEEGLSSAEAAYIRVVVENTERQNEATAQLLLASTDAQFETFMEKMCASLKSMKKMAQEEMATRFSIE